MIYLLLQLLMVVENNCDKKVDFHVQTWRSPFLLQKLLFLDIDLST